MYVSKVRLQAFGRACQLTIDNSEGRGEALIAMCREELARLEAKFSAYDPNSITSKLNQSAGTGVTVPLDAEASSLFNYIDALWKQSKHLFDPTTRILRNCYDTDGHLRASKEQLNGMLKLVGLNHLERTDSGAHLARKGMLLDLNSCIRPYAVDSLKRRLLKQGAKHALIEMDQDIATIGKEPSGANWLIGVRLPKGNSAAISRLKLNNQGFAMRGDFEQSVLVNGERFGRALSPIDGHPIPGLLSVIVSADTCLAASGAATVARLKTESAGIKWLESLELGWLAVDRNLQCHGPLAS
ncbi:MAG: FAD:protein FMN transferase [Gammaproteobacteria bacterium]|nr:FAD:protein FMN transferase [Gammaproteobacteria bacterium]